MYKETKPPCYGCTPPKRHSTCHSECEDYIDWKNERQAGLEEVRKAQDIDCKLKDAEIKRHTRIKQRKKNKRSFGI